LLDRVREGYATDEYFADGDADADVLNEQLDGLWLRDGAVIVPADDRLRDDILYEAHDAAASGHFGVKATLKRLEGNYVWLHGRLKLSEHVAEYLRTCTSCQHNRASNQKPGGLLQPMPVLPRPWASVSADFVTGLPVTDLGADAILVFVDRFTKMVHLVATRKDLTASGCAQLLFNAVIRLHGIPDDIVSDRDKLFTSHFWQELCRLLWTKQKMSTTEDAFHPQTDGQTERTNRTLQEVLSTVSVPSRQIGMFCWLVHSLQSALHITGS
jgi:Integrase zinc binding domain/Integrase core domain